MRMKSALLVSISLLIITGCSIQVSTITRQDAPVLGVSGKEIEIAQVKMPIESTIVKQIYLSNLEEGYVTLKRSAQNQASAQATLFLPAGTLDIPALEKTIAEAFQFDADKGVARFDHALTHWKKCNFGVLIKEYSSVSVREGIGGEKKEKMEVKQSTRFSGKLDSEPCISLYEFAFPLFGTVQLFLNGIQLTGFTDPHQVQLSLNKLKDDQLKKSIIENALADGGSSLNWETIVSLLRPFEDYEIIEFLKKVSPKPVTPSELQLVVGSASEDYRKLDILKILSLNHRITEDPAILRVILTFEEDYRKIDASKIIVRHLAQNSIRDVNMVKELLRAIDEDYRRIDFLKVIQSYLGREIFVRRTELIEIIEEDYRKKDAAKILNF